jgi:hypothetical protein
LNRTQIFSGNQREVNADIFKVLGDKDGGITSQALAEAYLISQAKLSSAGISSLAQAIKAADRNGDGVLDNQEMVNSKMFQGIGMHLLKSGKTLRVSIDKIPAPFVLEAGSMSEFGAIWAKDSQEIAEELKKDFPSNDGSMGIKEITKVFNGVLSRGTATSLLSAGDTFKSLFNANGRIPYAAAADLLQIAMIYDEKGKNNTALKKWNYLYDATFGPPLAIKTGLFSGMAEHFASFQPPRQLKIGELIKLFNAKP